MLLIMEEECGQEDLADTILLDWEELEDHSGLIFDLSIGMKMDELQTRLGQ